MSQNINIEEIVEDKTSWYAIRRFKVGNIKFERPEKSLDVNLSRLTRRDYEAYVSKQHNFKIYEASKKIDKFQKIEGICTEEDNAIINAFFNKTRWIKNDRFVINFTLNFNPFKSVRSIEDISGFFDYYHQYSKLFLFVPNIRLNKIVFKKKVPLIDLYDYIRFVDSVYDLLNTKNNKPIFVPVSLRFSIKDIEQLVHHYLDKQYYYYWFDFEGKSISDTQIARIDHFFTEVKKSGYYDRVLPYFTNIKREIISNINDDKTPASDVLASIAGANIIGTNREPQRDMSQVTSSPPDRKTLIEHKSRKFNGNTYYYEKRKRIFPSKNINNIQNSILLQQEFTNQSNYFLTNLQLVNYLQEKEMLISYNDGRILEDLTTRSRQPLSLLDFF